MKFEQTLKTLKEEYILAIYKSKNIELINNIENFFKTNLKYLPYDLLSLNVAIEGIKMNLHNLKFIRKELQENEIFIDFFTKHVYDIIKSKTYAPAWVYICQYDILNSFNKYIRGDDLILYFKLNY